MQNKQHNTRCAAVYDGTRYMALGTGYWVLGTLLLCFCRCCCCCCCSLVLMALLNIFWGMHKYIWPRWLPFLPPPQLSFCPCNEQSWKLLLFSAYGCTRAPKHTRALDKRRRERRGVRETRRGLKRGGGNIWKCLKASRKSVANIHSQIFKWHVEMLSGPNPRAAVAVTVAVAGSRGSCLRVNR